MTAAHPSKGGIAPDAPPITIFIGVAGFKKIVYMTAYAKKVAKVSHIVSELTKK